MEDILFDLYYKSAHRNEELEQTNEELEQTNARLSHKIEKQNQKIGDMQKEIERLHKVFDIKDEARVELVKENKKLKSCLTIADNDYKKCYAENVRLAEENNKLQCDINDLKQARNEIKLLNNQIDNLITENNQLKFRNKMLTKIGLNSIYGIHCCKNHCVYTDTDSIKETTDNDSNN